MKILAYIGYVLAALVIALAGFLWHLGAFSRPAVTEEMTGPYTYIYESFIGSYKDTGPVFDRVHTALLKEGIKTTKALGIYHDDPRVVPAERLRSDCACILEGDNISRVPQLALKGYKAGTLNAAKRIVVEFPLENQLSFMIGAMKAYPEIVKYAREKKMKLGKACELYDMQKKKIFYMMETVR